MAQVIDAKTHENPVLIKSTNKDKCNELKYFLHILFLSLLIDQGMAYRFITSSSLHQDVNTLWQSRSFSLMTFFVFVVRFGQ
ncbi:hypothetical protein A9237_22845 [Vibrio owensii]|nr:hypothetical protein A9237_22845 [Vibrio owensii]